MASFLSGTAFWGFLQRAGWSQAPAAGAGLTLRWGALHGSGARPPFSVIRPRAGRGLPVQNGLAGRLAGAGSGQLGRLLSVPRPPPAPRDAGAWGPLVAARVPGQAGARAAAPGVADPSGLGLLAVCGRGRPGRSAGFPGRRGAACAALWAGPDR